jgi:hypothetical protein
VRPAAGILEDADLPPDLRRAHGLQNVDHAHVANLVVALEDIAVFPAPDSVSNRVIVDVAETVGKGFVVVIVIVIVAVWRLRRSLTAVSGALSAQSHRLMSLYSFESASGAETIGEIGVRVGASEKAKGASEGSLVNHLIRDR